MMEGNERNKSNEGYIYMIQYMSFEFQEEAIEFTEEKQ